MNETRSSFRDPDGFVYAEEGVVYRQINQSYKINYDHLIESGLYDELVENDLLISHSEVKKKELNENAYKIIQPEQISFISYPYEWCFSQLKDAAITTLKLQEKALEYQMSLKDASAYNIQFIKNKPKLIDTLSFELTKKGQPWVAYKQFCQHFLAPLALMKYKDARLNQLTKAYLDGIPLDLASSLLPAKTSLKYPLLLHIHLHSKSQKKYINKPQKTNKNMSMNSLLGLIDSLKSSIKKMRTDSKSSHWQQYYEKEINYDKKSMEEKKRIVKYYLKKAEPTNIWDMGANIGVFSRIACENNVPTISFDIDHSCVEANYLRTKEKNEKNIMPLLLDLTNPSPGIGWNNQERMSLIERGPADTIMALALIHHLAITNNIPLNLLASFFNQLCNKLIIEYIPKQDSNAKRLWQSREDIFQHYTKANFEHEFRKYFIIKEKQEIKGTQRIMYLMVKK
ncbi:MAG: SAM-dependent methyltransferase [Candidatus Altiarchaeales archaeon ex4484_96]|nr:MAG: SAM-dependent methyltransferase [Candidatus Altiarchaeales archaeon ex4484_96]